MQHIQRLENLARWLPHIPNPHDTQAGPTGPRTGPTTPNPNALPHRLHHILDTATTDGPTGVTTRQGAEAILAEWWTHIAHSLALPNPPHATPLAHLIYHHHAITHQYPDWDTYNHAITLLHGRVAYLTGNHPDRHGPCPHCTHPVASWPTPQGMSRPACTDCLTDWDTPQAYLDALQASHLHQLRQVAEPGHWVTRRQLAAIHPDLSPDTLDSWRHRDTIPTRRDKTGRVTYDLAAINKRHTQPTLTNRDEACKDSDRVSR